MRKALVVSATSDIGAALCEEWIEKGWQVSGTYRTPSKTLDAVQGLLKDPLVKCDLIDPSSIEAAAQYFSHHFNHWDVLVFAPGTLEPIGSFEEVDFDVWEKGLMANCIGPLRFLRRLLSFRNKGGPFPSTVIFFAGAGTNGPAPGYSCYAISKIALIKMCELLDAEIPDTRFVIVGPGWVKTKIHEETLKAGEKAGKNLHTTIHKLESNECTPMSEVIECINWLVETSCHAVRGRNYSVAFDKWGKKELEEALGKDPHLYKLRRHQVIG